MKGLNSKPKIFDLDQKFEKKEFFDIPPFLDLTRKNMPTCINTNEYFNRNKGRPDIFKNYDKKDRFRIPSPLLANENSNFLPRNLERGLVLPFEHLSRENENNNNLGFVNSNNSQEGSTHRKKEKCFKKEDIERCFPHNVFFKQKNLDIDEECKTCSICWCEFEDQEKIRFMPCLHRFHMECIDLWLVKHITCPYCKKDLVKLIKEAARLYK